MFETFLLRVFLTGKDTVLNSNFTHIDDFDRYESGDMNAAELAGFRKRLATEQEFVAEYDLYRTLKAGIKTFHRQRLKAQFAESELQMQPKSILFHQDHTIWKLGIAASAAILLAAGIYFWKSGSEKNWQKAYIEEPGLPVLMSHNTNQFNQAMNFYRQGQFTEALHNLPATTSDTVAFYRGIFWLKLQKPDSAFRYLNTVSQDPRSVFGQKADYYTAMALWQADKTADAKAIFENIAADENHPFREISENILKDSF